MAEEYVQDSSGGSLGGVVGTNAAWLAYHRTRQQSFALTGRPISRANTPGGKFGYFGRTMFGYTSTMEEFKTWNNPWGREKLFAGGVPAKATYMLSKPVMAAQMSVHGGNISANNAFRGMSGVSKIRAAGGVMDAEKLGVWLTESMIKNKGVVATKGLSGAWNAGMVKFMGASVVDDAAAAAVKAGTGSLVRRGAQESVEMLAKTAGTRLAVKAGGTIASRVVGYAAGPIGVALMAYDIAQLTYYGATGAFKIGEAIHYKIPKAYFQAASKNLMRSRFEGFGPASAMTPENLNNRMRAVQAIQGSRLNARSALGNEAGLLAGHFG